MPGSYASYTEISLNALEFNPKAQDVIEKKKEIIASAAQHHGSKPTSVLFYGFSPMMLGLTYTTIAVTYINDHIKDYLDSTGIKYTYINEAELAQHKKEFSWVVAGEEYFTFARTEEEQKTKLELAASLAKTAIITTLRDYKNQDFKDREFSQPLAIYNHGESKIFLEYHNYDFEDKNSWQTTVHELTGESAILYGSFARRSMFFKQMAKFSIDAGAKNFYVHKNLMYKSLIKKNYEHVISISF
jgi:hypothetical protein